MIQNIIFKIFKKVIKKTWKSSLGILLKNQSLTVKGYLFWYCSLNPSAHSIIFLWGSSKRNWGNCVGERRNATPSLCHTMSWEPGMGWQSEHRAPWSSGGRGKENTHQTRTQRVKLKDFRMLQEQTSRYFIPDWRSEKLAGGNDIQAKT